MADFPDAPLRIAVAEDEPANRKLLVRLLEALGHEVPIAVADGHDLVDQCRTAKIDLIFADFHLPTMDGLAAAELLAEKGIPVVIVSGHPDAENIRIDYEPIEMVIRKPASIEDLRDAIHGVMTRPRSEHSASKLGS